MSAVIVEKLTKKYGNHIAVDALSFRVNKGEVFGLLGENGAGKSTTIECILGTKSANCGTITILGGDPRKDRKKLFQKIGVQFQQCDYQPEIKVYELCEETAIWQKACRRGCGVHFFRAVLRCSLHYKHMRRWTDGTSPRCCRIQRAQDIEAFSSNTGKPINAAYGGVFDLCGLLYCINAYAFSCGNAYMECTDKRHSHSVSLLLAADDDLYIKHWNDGWRSCQGLKKRKCYRFPFILPYAYLFRCYPSL